MITKYILELYKVKNEYTKPVLGTKKYAQFENVYANCNNISKAADCKSNPGQGGGQDDNIQFNNGYNYIFGNISGV